MIKEIWYIKSNMNIVWLGQIFMAYVAVLKVEREGLNVKG